ncbi:restriction endonuclease subunit S [Acaryochloris marina]|uniref:Type I restriction-modification enzyme S subunit n=1 Tax=Acaryochloris marina (strain MBIC 11017) TaxID=329726 RepID=B0CE92_ACAM1|nr:restriction endonuclease subunit S [Acaryochloris marina]ABW25726.1 type I restriction-modification enzyme S subunit [Acaryochloris marina MBIC11017]BDM80596.1 type I restriction modification enzyme protein S [Acaryochloris marina MBIC10699]
MKLKEVCRFLNGGTPSKKKPEYFEGEIPWITGADINGPIVNSARSYITEEAILNSATKRVPPNTVLLVTRTSVGKVAVSGMELCYSQDITSLWPDLEKLDIYYLTHFLRSRETYLKGQSRGATIKGVTKGVLENLSLHLPPIAEQKRIAGILDAADALRVKRRDAISTLDALLQSTFLTLFGDPITNPMGWDASDLEAVSEKITDGTHKTPKYTESGIEFLSAKDIKNGSIKWNTGKFISEDEHKSLITRCHPEIGDVLLAKSGSLGSVAIIDRDHEFSLFESLCLIKHNRQKIEAQFLTAMLESPRMQMHLLSRNKGISIKHLHLTDIRKLKILLPPLDKQRKFATIVASIEKQKAQQCAHLAELDTLFASLQSRAFNGEL